MITERADNQLHGGGDYATSRHHYPYPLAGMFRVKPASNERGNEDRDNCAKDEGQREPVGTESDQKGKSRSFRVNASAQPLSLREGRYAPGNTHRVGNAT